jgi:translocation and assembly module TamB
VSHARRIVRGVLIGTGALAALAVVLAAFVLFTTPGATLVVSIANRRDLPVRVQSIEGALARRVVLRGVELKFGPVQASLDTVIVAWHPLELRHDRLHVGDVTVAGARVVVAPGPASKPDTLQPSATVNKTRWSLVADHVRVRNASVEAPGNVRLHGIDIAAGGSPEDYHATVRASGSAWRLTGFAAYVRASGNVRAAMVDSLDVRALGGALQGNGYAGWKDGFSWRARVHGDSLRVGELASAAGDWLGAISFRTSSTGRIHDDSTRVAVDLQSLAGTLRDRPLAARARIDIDGARIAASDARVQWGTARATLSGGMAQAANVRFDATVPALGEILPRARGALSAHGTLTGSPSRIEVDVAAHGRDIRAGRFDAPTLDAVLDATVSAENCNPHTADLRRVTISIGESRAEASGKISWRGGIAWDGTVTTEGFEASLLTPPRWNLHGPVSIQATTDGARRGHRVHGRLGIESLSGRLRGLALAGEGKIAVNNGEADISALRLQWGETRVIADGHAGKTMDLEFDVTAPNLAAIDSSLHGSLSLRGEIAGARKTPRVVADITADSMRISGYGARRLEGHVDADLAFASPADVRLLVLGAARGEMKADTVRVSLTGPRDDVRASVAVARSGLSAALALHGALSDTDGRSDPRVGPAPHVTWSGWIEDARLRHATDAPEWRLRARAPLFMSRSRVKADSLVLASGSARVSAHGAWQRGGTTHAELGLSGFELSAIERFLGEGTTMTGALNGAASVTIDPAGGIVARVDLVPGPGEVARVGRKVGYEGHIAGHADSSGVFAEVAFALKEAGARVATVDAKVSIPGFVPGRDSLGTQPIEGGLDVECPNVAPIVPLLVPAWSKAGGSLTAHLEPTGTAGDFRLSGRLALENGRIDLPSGLRLRDTRITMVSDGAGEVSLDGEVTSGGGRVVMKASSARSEQGWVKGTFTAKGERFQAVNQPEAQIFISPDVEVQLAERIATVAGRVRVPYARIETAEVPASAATPSNDVVFVEDTLSTRPKLQVRTQIRVELADSVTFTGFGLYARLAGSLAVDDERGRPTRGTGEIQIVEGRYRAFGNELKIDPGRFVFGGGPIDNPGLDIRAYRGLTTQNVMAGSGEVVGMKLFGTLRKPQFSVFSNPPMSQSEIMSYLVTGRPMSTSGEQSALANAAMLVGMQKGTNVVGDIGKKLALDEAYLESGSDIKETAFVAGKYLSPKLYVSYAAGLFENTNTFRARYSLTPRWTLQTESGKQSGTDLLYWFERGK